YGSLPDDGLLGGPGERGWAEDPRFGSRRRDRVSEGLRWQSGHCRRPVRQTRVDQRAGRGASQGGGQGQRPNVQPRFGEGWDDDLPDSGYRGGPSLEVRESGVRRQESEVRGQENF